MGLNEEQQKRLADKAGELQQNVRHITQLTMNWFAFFVTINYASMGWLAAGSGTIHPVIIGIIAGVFIVQNILGMVAIREVEQAAWERSEQVRTYECPTAGQGDDRHHEILRAESIPAGLYTRVESLMSWVLISLVVAWGAFAILRFIS